jgi:hypothetical protein
MTNGIVKHEQKFPTAHVPGATSIEEVFEAWESAGLQPVEVASEDLEQRISIKHNALTGQVEWRTEKMDGVQALGIMATTMLSLFEVFFKAQARPKFSSGEARVAVYLDGERLTVGISPLHDPTVVKGALAAALWEIVTRAGGTDPAREWLDLFVVERDGLD